MPSKFKRHTCVKCGAKRVEPLMLVHRRPHFGLVKWVCNSDLLNKKIGVSNYCSKRTPQVK